MKALFQLLPLLCLCFILTSCGPSQVATSSNPMHERDVLYANSWDLAELNGSTILRTDDEYSYITFNPNTNRIAGYTSCNYLGGSISLTEPSGITFDPIVTTKRACPGNTLDVSLVPALRGVDRWARVNDQLVMYDDGKVIARWTPSRFSDDDLTGNWRLDYISDREADFDVLYPVAKRPTLVFAADNGVVTGSTGYNTFNCPVKVRSNGIAFADCSATKMACEGPGEAMFMDDLKTINNYTFADDNTLVLFTDDDTVLRFKRIK